MRSKRPTAPEFFARARSVHGDRYDYSNTVYAATRTKVVIGCPVHGEFRQQPSTHLAGSGCQRCFWIERRAAQRPSVEEFRQRAAEVHGDRYDYSQVVYVSTGSPVKIGCAEHGEFLQKPGHHFRGNGCPKCGKKSPRSPSGAPVTQESFIAQCRAYHGDRYDYSVTVYAGAKNKIRVICPEHGEFATYAGNHATRTGCPACGRERTRARACSSDETLLRRLAEKYGDRYDFSKVIYRGHKVPVIVICPEHGEFSRRPDAILRSFDYACLKCSAENRQCGMRRKPDTALLEKASTPHCTADFVNQANQLHGALYGYESVEFKAMRRRVAIRCPAHGIFKQLPALHLTGSGCPQCAGNAVMTQEEFIAKAQARHGDKLNYDDTTYTSNSQPITVRCRIHGAFTQNAGYHLKRNGCPRCVRWTASPAEMTRDTFIARAQSSHGELYDYSGVPDIVQSQVKLHIKCKTHGSFQQAVKGHLGGKGCQACMRAKAGAKLLTPSDVFLARLRSAHGESFDFSNTVYRGNRHKISVGCRFHGDFLIAPFTMLNGGQCPRCITHVGAYSIKNALRIFDSRAWQADRPLWLYLTRQFREGEEPFLNIGLACNGYRARYGVRHPYRADPNPDVVQLASPFAILLEQVLLQESRQHHYRPGVKFEGGVHECRSLEALPLLGDRLTWYTLDPYRLLDSTPVLTEATASGLLGALDKARGWPTAVTHLRDLLTA